MLNITEERKKKISSELSKISLSWNVNHKLQISIPKGAFTVKAKWQELMDNDELKVNVTYPYPKILVLSRME